MLTFEEWRHTYADVFETDDAARAAWTAACNRGYRAGMQDTRDLLSAHNAGARASSGSLAFDYGNALVDKKLDASYSAGAQEPVAWRHKWTNNHDDGWAYKEAGPTTDELRIGIPGILGRDSHRECWEPLYAHPQPMTDAARDVKRYHGRTIEELKEICTTRPARYPQAHHDFDKTILALIDEIESLDRAKGE